MVVIESTQIINGIAINGELLNCIFCTNTGSVLRVKRSYELQPADQDQYDDDE
jgi:hypothetical protein